MRLPRIIVRYLPQFHRVKENDIWWGEGFTDWVAVKNAAPLFEGHKQPRIPLRGNYYDLMQKSTMQWQANIAKQYGIDGFAFYHYWFGNGKQILERPAENLLHWNDIDMSFCFCWANETWARTWSKLDRKNTWADVYEEDSNMKSGNGILIKQVYGESDEWLAHIEYMLPFFQDNRYIKIHGKPVILIYQPNQILCLPDMLDCWQKFLQSNGFPGIYVIGEITAGCDMVEWDMDATLLRATVLSRFPPISQRNGVIVYSYDECWKFILDTAYHSQSASLFEGIVDYDDTPRRGSSGCAYGGVTLDKFQKYFSSLFALANQRNHDFIFLNAWNEWGESNYLEPDSLNGYSYLQVVRNIKLVYENDKELANDFVIQMNVYPGTLYDLQSQKQHRDIAKHCSELLDWWLEIRLKGLRIADYLLHHGYRSLAIYGVGRMGKHLLTELIDKNIVVKYAIDKKDINSLAIPVYKVYDHLPEVDVVVVTPIGQYNEIWSMLHSCLKCKTISLEHIIHEIYMQYI